MPRNRVQQANPNLSKAKFKDIESDMLDDVKDLSDLKREANNIFKGKRYRIDSKPIKTGANGCQSGDYKVDVQTVGKKTDSVTVAVVFLDPGAPNTSLGDFKFAVEQCCLSKDVYRVT